MKNNKRVLLALAAGLLAATALASCEKYEAKPDTAIYDAKLIEEEGDTYNNSMARIYDALVNPGDSNSSKILNNVLYIYSESIYGKFFDEKVYKEDGTLDEENTKKGLFSLAKAYLNDSSDSNLQALKAFCEAHSGYEKDGETDTDIALNLFEDIVYRIKTTFRGYVTNSSYQDRGQFYEEKFFNSQVAAYYSLAEGWDEATQGYPYNDYPITVKSGFVLDEHYPEADAEIILDGEFEGDGDSDGVNPGSRRAYFKNIFATYEKYIEKSILPDIYRNQLTTKYLYETNFQQIRVSQERKVSFISLDNGEQNSKMLKLLDTYAETYIEPSSHPLYTTAKNCNFFFLDNIYKGTTKFVYDESSAEYAAAEAIYAQAEWTPVVAGPGGYLTSEGTYVEAPKVTVDDVEITIDKYYKESSLGAIMDSYLKLSDNRYSKDDSSARDTFTSSGSYDVQTGLTIKIRELLAEDHVQSGWYDSSALSELPSECKTRLFSDKVAIDVDQTRADDPSAVYSASTGYADADNSDGTLLTHGMYRGGDYYLLPKSPTNTEHPYIVDDSSKRYLIRVDEAVKSFKITEGGSHYYNDMPKHLNATEHRYFEDNYAYVVGRKIAYGLSTNDSWRKAANKYYVNEMAIMFHDDYVYDYFVSTFPTLFD